MDCKTAKAVYLSSAPFASLLILHQKALEVLEYVAKGLHAAVTKQQPVADKFNHLVHDQVGPTKVPYFITHRTDADDSETSRQLQEIVGDETSRRLLERHFSGIYGLEVRFSLICCNGCNCSAGEMDLDELIRVQTAAVAIDAEALDLE